jgi:hypothetical protein
MPLLLLTLLVLLLLLLLALLAALGAALRSSVMRAPLLSTTAMRLCAALQSTDVYQ